MAEVTADGEKMIKTGLILTIANMILAPVYYVSDKTGLALSIGCSALLLKLMHDMGEQQRPAANAINQIQGFFAPNTNNSLDNNLSNIIEGGGALFDDITAYYQQK